MTFLQLFKKAIQSNIITKQSLHQLKCEFCRLNKKTNMPSDIELLKELRRLKLKFSSQNFDKLSKLLQTRPMRTMSGVSILTVLTKPWPCPGQCIYCPTEDDMPKSYLKSEPAAQRAWLTGFDPIKQIQTRLKALKMTGHPTEKTEVIILGGTWPSYNYKYKLDFIKKIFATLNNPRKPNFKEPLSKLQSINEVAKHRCIGLTIETRPDWVTLDLIQRWRKFGITRVELGVQNLDYQTLKTTQRTHTAKTVQQATQLLKDNGFKIVYHIMPGLPKTKFDKRAKTQKFRDDIQIIKTLFKEPGYYPDQMKIYPCSVIKNTLLYNWWQAGHYQPYSSEDLKKLLPKLKKLVPPFVRLERVMRDIPATDVKAGSLVTNMRQILHNVKVKCQCIRCREAKQLTIKDSDLSLVTRQYKTLGGQETFLSFEDKKRDKIFALLRLRLPDSFNSKTTLNSLKSVALIRELHTFGKSIPTSDKTKDSVQHLGLGKRLMLESERLAKNFGYKNVAVISGIGARGYYAKLGYNLGKDNYMFKKL